MSEQLLTVKDVAKITGFNRQSIAWAIRHKNLKAIMYGHTYIIQPADLRAYIENHRHPSMVAHIDLDKIFDEHGRKFKTLSDAAYKAGFGERGRAFLEEACLQEPDNGGGQ
jgi:hypothetical protein